MRKILSAILVVLLCFATVGCNATGSEYSTPVTFFYCTDEADYSVGSSVIQRESRTVDIVPNDIQSILQLYLEGPVERGMYSPFPKDLTVTELQIDGETTYITFSTNLSYLTGADLTLACACIANTCFSLTHTQNVDISAEHALLDNMPSVFISYGSTLTSDIH